MKERMRSTLVNLGFTKTETDVYMLLVAHSPQTARDIAKALDLNCAQIYRVLKRLHSNGAIAVFSEHPTRYSAIVFEKVLELLITAKKEQHKTLLARKKELLFTWKAIIEKKDVKSRCVASIPIYRILEECWLTSGL